MASHPFCGAQVDLDGAADSRTGDDRAESKLLQLDRNGEGSLPSSDAHATGAAGTAARLPAPEPRYDAEDSSRHARHPDAVLPHQAAAEARTGVIDEDDSTAHQYRCMMHLARSLPLSHSFKPKQQASWSRGPIIIVAPSSLHDGHRQGRPSGGQMHRAPDVPCMRFAARPCRHSQLTLLHIMPAVARCTHSVYETPVATIHREKAAARSVSQDDSEDRKTTPLPLLSPVVSDQKLNERQPSTHHARRGGEVSSVAVDWVS